MLSNIDYKLAEALVFKNSYEDGAKTPWTGTGRHGLIIRGVPTIQYSALALVRFARKKHSLLQQQGVQVMNSYTALPCLHYPALVFKFF